MPEDLRPSQPAGAVLTYRDARPVVAHYGSAAGELATCLRSVGLARRADLVACECAERRRSWGRSQVPATGGILFEGGGWRCAASDRPATTVLVGRPSSPIFSQIAAPLDRSLIAEPTAIVNVVGPWAADLLASGGLFGEACDPRTIPPFCGASLAGRPVRVISQTLTNFLVLTDALHADLTWRALTETGRSYAAAAIGIDAVERRLLLEPGRHRLI